MVLTEMDTQFADGTVVCPGKSSLLPEMVAQTMTGTKKDHRDLMAQDKGQPNSRVSRHEQNES